MNPKVRWAAGIAIGLMVAAALVTSASPPVSTDEVTDYGRNRDRTHYTPTGIEYPLDPNVQAIWEVPLGLSRSQPLVVQRNYTGSSQTRIFHNAGDTLWALNGNMIPPARQPDQNVDSYRQELANDGFIIWSTPAENLCKSSDLLAKDPQLALACEKQGPRKEQRPFASSQAAYWKGRTPADDVIYVGFGHPASVVAIRATDGKMLGGYIIETNGDRGIVGAPLVFEGDTVVIGTTNGESFIIRGLASGTPSALYLPIGGRISFSPIPNGDNSFIIAADARPSAEMGPHGYMMAYNLGNGSARPFSPAWPAAVVTPSGIPGEAAADANTVFLADKYGRLYALRQDSGQMLWCRQYPGMGPCRDGGDPEPAFINNGPGVDENNVYYVYRNNQGPNDGGGHIVALNKATGQVVWQKDMEFQGNTAPVPMG